MKKDGIFKKQDYINLYKLLKYKNDSTPIESGNSILFDINKISIATIKLFNDLIDGCNRNYSKIETDIRPIEPKEKSQMLLTIKKRPVTF